jgi:hypothetical protein
MKRRGERVSTRETEGNKTTKVSKYRKNMNGD